MTVWLWCEGQWTSVSVTLYAGVRAYVCMVPAWYHTCSWRCWRKTVATVKYINGKPNTLFLRRCLEVHSTVPFCQHILARLYVPNDDNIYEFCQWSILDSYRGRKTLSFLPMRFGSSLMAFADRFWFVWNFLCETKPNQRLNATKQQLIRWVRPKQMNDRCENALLFKRCYSVSD